MAPTDHKLNKIITLQYLKPLLFSSCVVFLILIFYEYATDKPFSNRANTITNYATDKQLPLSSIRTAFLMEDMELAKVIASSDLFNRLSKAIISLDPQMMKKDLFLKSLQQIDVYSILKASMEQEEGGRGESKNDIIKSKPSQVIQPQADQTVKAPKDSKPKPQAQQTLKSEEEPMPKSQTQTLAKMKIDTTKLNCKEKQLAGLEKIYLVNDVHCAKLFSGDHDEIVRAIKLVNGTHKKMLSNEFYINSTAKCRELKKSRGYVTCPLTLEEEDFPIAYSILIFKDIEMVERLLRSIYRPQNYYCIHVDKKADHRFFHAITEIAGCFENVFIPPERIDVKWGRFSVLEPELVCMKHLWKYKKWKYFINLTGQEFPLKTNWELVQILKAYNGANDVGGTVKRANKDRWKTSPPHNITPVKGAVHITVNREFVDYLLHNQTAKDLIEWSKPTGHPDETIFATLNHNPQLGIRGTYKGEPETEGEDSMVKPFLTRFKHWHVNCTGRFVRAVCILSTGELPQLGVARQLFANKFYLWEDPIVIGCLEEMLFNNTKDELSGAKLFNSTYYSQLGFVKNQVT